MLQYGACERMRRLLCAVFLAGGISLPCVVSATVDNGRTTEVTLSAVRRPLSEVLENLARLSGCQFVFDAAWADVPVTVIVHRQTVEKALKKILMHLNHAVVFGADNQVVVKIYDTVPENQGRTGEAVAVSGHDLPTHSAEPELEENEPFDETATDAGENAAVDADAKAGGDESETAGRQETSSD